MAVPWVQIVQLMPSILDVSRELLKRSRRVPAPTPALSTEALPADAELAARITALEENERRQAELVTNIADQLAQLTAAVTALHQQTRRLMLGQIAAVVIAVIAVLIALR
jgi:uncharacterized coiled-coil protein SlyX